MQQRSLYNNIYTVILPRYVSQLGEGRDCKRKWHDLSQSDTSNTESDTEFEEPELRLEVNILPGVLTRLEKYVL